jgi:hypothetical protein
MDLIELSGKSMAMPLQIMQRVFAFAAKTVDRGKSGPFGPSCRVWSFFWFFSLAIKEKNINIELLYVIQKLTSFTNEAALGQLIMPKQ